MERRRLAGIILLVVSAFTGTLAFRLATPAIAFYTRDTLNASMLAVSIVSMFFVLARAFSSVFGGLLLEKRKSFLHLGGIAMMGNALAVQLYPITSSWLQVAGIKLLNGFLNGLSWPMAQFVVAVTTPRKIRARVTAIYFLFGSIASLFGNYAYAYTIDIGLSGQMWISSVFFVLTGLIMIAAYILLNDWVVPRRKEKGSQRPSLDPRKVLVIASLMAVIVAFTSGEITYVYVSEALGLEKARTATLLGWIGFLASLLSYFSSWFADRISEVGMVKLTAFLAGISPLLAAVKTGPNRLPRDIPCPLCLPELQTYLQKGARQLPPLLPGYRWRERRSEPFDFHRRDFLWAGLLNRRNPGGGHIERGSFSVCAGFIPSARRGR